MTPGVVDKIQLYAAAAALIALLPLSRPAHAQEALEEIVVTGSRIARPDFESASPIVSVPRERFEQTGSATIDSTINSMPQFVPSVTSTSNNPGNFGQANISLRGLGTTSTLVLLDGRRVTPANGNGVVDLNIIPSSLIDSVEIITGGASAVYGSDAMAGVVNFKLRKSFDGVEIEGLWGQTDRSDGAQYDGSLSAGTDFAGGRGSIVGAVGYSKRELVTQADRAFSQIPLMYYGPGLGTPGLPPGYRFFGSPTAIEEGRFEVAASDAAFSTLFSRYGYSVCDENGSPRGCVPHQNNWSVNPDGTLFTTGNRVPGSVANLRVARDPRLNNDRIYTYDYAPDNAMQLPLERRSAYARAEFQFADAIEGYLQGLYADYDVSLILAPAPVMDLYMPATNPYIPADLKLLLDSRAEQDAPVHFGKRLSELGPRTENLTYEVHQVTAGLKGTVFDGWQYDAYAQWGANHQTDRQTNNASRSRIEDLTYAPDGGQSICGTFNPFGLDSISRECADYIAVDGTNRSEFDQFVAEATLTGSLFTMPAGEVRGVFGVFFKRDEYQYAADPVVSKFIEAPEGVDPGLGPRSDIAGFNPSDDIVGDDSNVDVYVEVLVPILADVPGVHRLEAVGGYRHSDYQSIGGADAYKGELLYQPVKPLTLRGSYQRAVRAPSVFELSLPQLPFDLVIGPQGDVEDPCAYDSGARNGPYGESVEALCRQQGIPAALLPAYQDTDGNVNAVTGGNPDLAPEHAETVTIGVVFDSPSDVPLLAHLQVSLDWYQIEILDQISDVTAAYAISACYDATVNPTFSPDNRWCQTFRRDPVTGEMADAHEIKQNIAGSRTSGLDLQIDWRFDAGPGQVAFNWLVSYLDSFEVTSSEGAAPDEMAGGVGDAFFEGAQPEWKWTLNLGYTVGQLALNSRWNHIAGVVDRGISREQVTDPSIPSFNVPAYDYLNVDASYDFDDGLLHGLTVRVGVENVTDKDPPLFPSWVQANTDPAQYDVMGRRYYVGLKYAF